MEVAVENLSELRRKLIITLPENEVRKDLDKAYDKLNKEVTLKGFRRGKVPRSILEKNFREKVEASVVEELIQSTYFDAVEQEGIDPVVHPEIVDHKFNEDGTLTYVAEVDIRPVFKLNEYKGVTIEKPSIEVNDAEFNQEVEKLRLKHSVLRTAAEDHSIKNNDVATVDFQGFYNGNAMKEVHNENYSIDIGAGRLGKEFEEKLIGMKAGEKTLHEISFPGDYPNPVMAGKTIEFKVDIKSIKERILPELNDEFAKDVDNEYETLDDFNKGLRERLLKAKEESLQGDLSDRMMRKIIETHDFEIPERLVRYEVEEMIKQTEETLKKSGLTLESAGINRDELAERNRKIAEKRVRGDFILKKIAEEEDIKLADEDLERGYQRVATQYSMTVPDVKQFFQRREELMPFMNELLNEKIINYLLENANVIEASEDAKESDVAEEIK